MGQETILRRQRKTGNCQTGKTKTYFFQYSSTCHLFSNVFTYTYQTKNINFSFNFQGKSESIKLQNLVDLYKPAITTCKYGPDFGKDDIDCYSDDSTDLGGFGRKNQELPATNPRFGLTTTEDKKDEADASAINFGKRQTNLSSPTTT